MVWNAISKRNKILIESIHLSAELKAAIDRAEKAERERDEARAQAVWAHLIHGAGWVAKAPGALYLTREGWLSIKARAFRGSLVFDTEAEALAAGRAVPWWEVNP